jgi:hypothetical protein
MSINTVNTTEVNKKYEENQKNAETLLVKVENLNKIIKKIYSDKNIYENDHENLLETMKLKEKEEIDTKK